MFDIAKPALTQSALDQINSVINDPKNPLIKPFMDAVAKFGIAEDVNAKATEIQIVPSRNLHRY